MEDKTDVMHINIYAHKNKEKEPMLKTLTDESQLREAKILALDEDVLYLDVVFFNCYSGIITTFMNTMGKYKDYNKIEFYNCTINPELLRRMIEWVKKTDVKIFDVRYTNVSYDADIELIQAINDRDKVDTIGYVKSASKLRRLSDQFGVEIQEYSLIQQKER